MQVRNALGFHSFDEVTLFFETFDEVTLETISWKKKKKAATASVQNERSISLTPPQKH